MEEEKKVKPIKRHELLLQFSREHHFGLLLVWKIRQGLKKGIATERIRRYVVYFVERELQFHFEKEEVELLVKLPEGDTLKQQTMQEHQVIFEMIDDLRSGKNDTLLLQSFADVLESHIRFEERTLFAHLQQLMPNDPSDKVFPKDNTVKEIYNKLDDEWSDHFWVEEPAASQ